MPGTFKDFVWYLIFIAIIKTEFIIANMNRNYKQLLDKYLEYFPCVAIVGPRQCGKSYFLGSLPEGWKRFDMERAADRRQVEVDPDLFFRLNPRQVAIDESQELPQIFTALRVAIDSDRATKGRFIVTGSSSPDLVKSISESLAGRVGIIEMAPFSLAEAFEKPVSGFYRLLTGEMGFDSIDTLLESSIDVRDVHAYWFSGGYPEPWISKDAGFSEAWQENYFKSYLYRDIAALFPRLNKDRFRIFIQMLAGLTGKVINYADVSRALDISQPAAKDYFDIAHGTFFWRQLRPFDKKSVRRIVRHPKGIIRDSGLLHHLLSLMT